MTNPSGQDAPRYVIAIDGLLFIIDTVVVGVVIGGLVGLLVGGTQHTLYQLTIGLIYGWVTSPGVSGTEVLVYLVLFLAVSGPLWHRRLRAYFTATSDDFEFGRDSVPNDTPDDVEVLPYSDGGSLPPNGNPVTSDTEWTDLVFDGPGTDEPETQGDFYRSSGRAKPTSPLAGATLQPDDDLRVNGGDEDPETEEAETPESASSDDSEFDGTSESEPREAPDSDSNDGANRTRDPTAGINEALAASRSRVETVSKSLTAESGTNDLTRLESDIRSIQSETTETIDALEDAFPPTHRDLEQEIARLREEEESLTASIESNIHQP